MAATGIVIIGRNEGSSLERAFSAARASTCGLSYVDWRSIKGSVEIAARFMC